jgi:hypothetical protein
MSATNKICLPLALTLAVCLTACSDLLANLDQTSQVGEQKQVAAVAVKSEPTHPDVPAHLVACATATGLKSPAKDAKAASADAKVAALQKLSEERRTCALAIVGWYKKVQAANKKAAGA